MLEGAKLKRRERGGETSVRGGEKVHGDGARPARTKLLAVAVTTEGTATTRAHGGHHGGTAVPTACTVLPLGLVLGLPVKGLLLLVPLRGGKGAATTTTPVPATTSACGGRRLNDGNDSLFALGIVGLLVC